MQGNAVLAGRTAATTEDMMALVYVLWEKKDDIPLIQKEISKLANPYDEKLRDAVRKFEEIRDSINSVTNHTDKTRASIEAKTGLEAIIGTLDNLIKDARKNGRDISAMEAKRAEIVNYNQANMEEALGLNLSFNGGPSKTKVDLDELSPF